VPLGYPVQNFASNIGRMSRPPRRYTGEDERKGMCADCADRREMMAIRVLDRLQGTGYLQTPGRRKRQAHYQLTVLQRYARTGGASGAPAAYGTGPASGLG